MSYQVDPALLAKLAALDMRIKESCDLIPLQRWGLDESVKEKLKQRKHRIVAQHLSKNERIKMSNARKQRLARQLGAVPTTISEVLKCLSESLLVKHLSPKNELPLKMKVPIREATKQGVIKKTPQRATSIDSSIDEGSGNDSEGETVADIKPEPKALIPKMKRKKSEKALRNEDGAEPNEKKVKLEEELTDLDKVNTKNLDPVEARNIAMMKLKKKIAAFKATRRGNKSAEDYENERKMKRRISKFQLKQKKNEEKTSGKEKRKQVIETVEVKKEVEFKSLQTNDVVSDDITYSKFDFIVKEDKKPLTKKDKRDKFTGKNYKRLLEKAEHRQEKIEKIREKNPEKADRIEESIKWNKVMKLAEGSKVKDNVELLKKAAKRKEKTKERSSKKWELRYKEVEEKKGKKQDRRDMNLKKRIDDAKKKKMEKLKKKGRIL